MREQDEREPMGEFEQALQKAMRRVNAPETLAAFLATAAEAEEHRQRSGSGWLRPNRGGVVYVPPKPRRWAVGALAAALLLAVLGTGAWRLQRERARQIALANQQFTAAVRVTDEALQQTREQLQRTGLNLAQ